MRLFREIDAHVITFRSNPLDVLNLKEDDTAAGLEYEAVQIFRSGCRVNFVDGSHRRGMVRMEVLAHALHCLLKSRAAEWFQKVVQGESVECLNGIFVERSGEYDHWRRVAQ